MPKVISDEAICAQTKPSTSAQMAVQLQSCDQSPLGKLVEQYNRLTSEGRVCEEKTGKKEARADYVVGSAALVEAMPYATPTPYPTYAWSAATSPWWTEPASTWPLTYAPNVTAETAAYSPYLAPQFQGLLSATVSGQAAMPSSSPSNSVVTCKSSSTSSVAAAAAAAAVLPQVGGGKFPTTRSNCECPNCQETERLGEFRYSLLFLHFYGLNVVAQVERPEVETKYAAFLMT
ncbi:unnamed protein product [Toxocara canis]|uniref:Uncharacterized protein n=1 Tax=Toxocara canis TaxID=6265 RepID=A0A183V8B9_TOXCA|nr:unnamed protein product [Toxocara canis]